MAQQGQGAATSLPPEFRFHPTDEELILHYLCNRAAAAPCPVPIIADLDIYNFDPWDLPSQAVYGDCEWYFFSPRDRKASASKALVFYKGRPPRIFKTAWIMHEYRLAADPLAAAVNTYKPIKFRNVSMRLDDWVLCRIYKKSGLASPMVPPLADYDHRAAHDNLSGGGSFGDAACSFYAHSSSSSSTCRTMITQQQPHAGRLPTIPSFSELFDDYAFAQILDAEAEQGATHHLAVHPSLNQLLPVGDSAHGVQPSYYAPSSSSPDASGGSAGKRKAESPEESSAKRLNGSCFDAPPQSATGWQAAASVLGGLSHQMLPQF
ncbi:hypothetical protein ZWY2020_010056 [Hordeum vulgare]|nr:hypothetical protein ZWY2020_010056 [Hordeum vulgare]